MRLNVKNRSFNVYQTLGSYNDVHVYLAREGASVKERYLINEIRCPQMIRHHLGELLSLQQEDSFAELVDVFSFNSRVYVVFKYSSPSLLMNYLHKNQLSLMEKLKLIDHYFFQLSFYSRFSPKVVHALTDPDNINVSQDGSVYFNFSLKPAHFTGGEDKTSLSKRIASLLRMVFSEELAGRKKQPLLVILEKCDKGLYRSIPEVKKDMLKVDTTSFWDRVKNYLHERKHVLDTLKNLGVTALVVVFFVLVYTQYIAPGPHQTADTPVPVTQIGDVAVSEEVDREEEQEQEQEEED